MSDRSLRIDPARELWLLWRQGPRPDVRRLLDRAGDLAPAQVAAVLRVDLRERWRIGERVPAADYLRDFPTLRRDPEAALEVIYGELLLREELGEAPAPEEYLRAYPEYAEPLRLLVELHRALGATSGPGPDVTATGASAVTLRAKPVGVPGIPPAPPSGACPAGYEILAELGRGGMGVVYKALQPRLNRTVALKMILAGDLADPETRVRFLQEAEVVARLQHPNIIQIYALGEQGGRPFVVLEYVAGGSLADRLDGTPQPAEAAARLVETLARAMHYAHRRGVVHRDLKPANVLLAADGSPKISDFGLAKLLQGDAGGSPLVTLTHTGAVLGTPSYMAPEQAEGRARTIGPAADVYALGAILYELLTGRCPFRGTTPLETLEQVRTLEPVPPRRLRPGLPRALETICLKCLEKEPSRRYADALALAEDLRRHLHGEPIAARDSHMLERLAGALRRGQHDKEFRMWGNIMLAFTPVCTVPHLIVFVTALVAPHSIRAALLVPWVGLLTMTASLFWINYSRIRLPLTPAVRQLAALFLGYLIVSITVMPISRILRIAVEPQDDLIFYPFFALVNGQLYFSLGGSYWGGCYVMGLATLLMALLMVFNLTFAPLVYAIIILFSHLAIGLHLRRLGCEAGSGAGEGLSSDRRPPAAP